MYISFLKEKLYKNNIKIFKEDFKKFKKEQKWGYYMIEKEELNNPGCDPSERISTTKIKDQLNNSCCEGAKINSPPQLNDILPALPLQVLSEDSPSIGKPSPMITTPNLGPHRIEVLCLQHLKECIKPVKIEVEDIKEGVKEENKEEDIYKNLIKENNFEELVNKLNEISYDYNKTVKFKEISKNIKNYMKRWKKKNFKNLKEEVKEAFEEAFELVVSFDESQI
jgi:hypothetical protein